MNDLISRQVAISAICSACGKIDCDKMDKCEKLQLPPANNSEIPNSSDTISRRAAIDALKQQAEAMSEWSNRYAEQRKGVLTAVNIVEDLPPVQLSTNLAEVGTDCISRQDAIALWDKYHYTIATDAIEYDAELRKLPPAQPAIVPCDYAKACNKVAMNRITSAVVYMEILEDFKEYGYVLVDMREVTT